MVSVMKAATPPAQGMALLPLDSSELMVTGIAEICAVFVEIQVRGKSHMMQRPLHVIAGLVAGRDPLCDLIKRHLIPLLDDPENMLSKQLRKKATFLS